MRYASLTFIALMVFGCAPSLEEVCEDLAEECIGVGEGACVAGGTEVQRRAIDAGCENTFDATSIACRMLGAAGARATYDAELESASLAQATCSGRSCPNAVIDGTKDSRRRTRAAGKRPHGFTNIGRMMILMTALLVVGLFCAGEEPA